MARTSGYEKLAAPAVGGLQPYVPGKPLEEVEREFGLKGSIKLASNENPLGPPPAVGEAIRTAALGINLYPDGAGFRLKRALAGHLGVRPEQITLGNGSNDVLVLLAETFLTPDVSAVYDEYSFVVYRLAVQATGAKARVARSLPADNAMPFGHELDAFRHVIDKTTRLVFIANPNNPTGTWLDRAALHGFLSELHSSVIVVLDEAYLEYVTEPDYPNGLEWLDEFPNLVITRTFSKIYALAGLRVGYAVSHPDIAELLNRVRQPFNVNAIAQGAALAALADTDFVSRSRESNSSGLRRLREGLERLGFATPASAGNFVLADMGQPAERYFKELLRQGIIVRPVANYGLENHLRISVGLPEQNERLLQQLAAIRDAQGPST